MADWRKIVLGGLAAAAGGAAAWYMRERTTPEPAYRLMRSDEHIEVRNYEAILVAEISHTGARDDALNRGYERLSAYIEGKDQPGTDGERIAMRVPVLQDSPDGKGEWRTRFVMPEDWSRDSLPPVPAGIRLEEVPARRIAAIRFAGSPKPRQLREREDELRRWLEREKLQPVGGFEYAFYNSPMIPPFLRRNEVWVPVSAD